MSSALPPNLLEDCEQVCKALQQNGELNLSPEEIAEIAAIVAYNLECGRAEKVMNREGLDLAGYIATVARIYADLHVQVCILRAGDHQAWEELWSELFSRVRGALRKVLGDASRNIPEARYEEFVQEACIDIFRGRYPYDCDFQAWKFRVLANRILKGLYYTNNPLDRPGLVRSIPEMAEDNGMEEEALLDWIAGLKEPPPDFVESVHIREHVYEAIARLPSEVQRQVAILSWPEPLEDEEIARRLGKTINAVYKIRQRARANLKRLLRDTE